MENINTTPEQREIQCLRCGEWFYGTVFRFYANSAPLTQVHCENCLAAIKREVLEASTKELEGRKTSKDAEWSKICPWEFRTLREGGNTNESRLMDEQPKIKDLLSWKFGQRGIILRSTTSGRCKTRAMFRLLRKLWEEGKTVAAMTSGDFDRQARDAGGTFTLTPWFDKLRAVDVFFLDDLGKGQWTPATESLFFELVDKRTIDGKPILITTNETGESLLTLLTVGRARPLIRRLRDYCEGIQF